MTVHLRLAVVGPLAPGGSPVVETLVVRAPDATTWGTLRSSVLTRTLADAFGHEAVTPLAVVPLECDGVALTDDHVVGLPPLLDGALVEPARARVAATTSLRLTCVNGPHQGSRMALPQGSTPLGRRHDLLADDELVSRRHGRVEVSRGAVSIEDLGSSNGTFLEGRRLEPSLAHPWRVGEHVRIGSTLLRLDLDEGQPDTWSSEAGAHGGRTGRDAPATPEAGGAGLHGTPIGEGHVTPEAPPRRAAPTAQEFAWPDAAETGRTTPLRWVAALAPVPVAILAAVLMHSAMMLCFMALGPVVMIATHLDDRRRGRTVGRSAAAEHERLARRCAQDVARALADERAHLRAIAPGPADLVDIAAGRVVGIGMRTADRRHLLRLGHGDAPSVHTVRRPGTAPSRLDLDEAPLCVTARPGELLHLDIAGADADTLLELIVAQLAVLGEPGERPVIITPLARSERWAWTACSPSVRVAANLPEELRALLDETAPTGCTGAPPLVVVDDRTTDMRDAAGPLLTLGAALVWVGHRPPALRMPTGATPGPRSHHAEIVRGHCRSTSPTGHRFTMDSPEPSWFPTVMRLHLRWAAPCEGPSVTAIDTPTSAFDLLPAPLEAAWSHPTTAVPIGRDHHGVLTLDLARTGPHALVAGTTGAGKSEFLLTYLRGLFALNSPADVNALLIDYKGGATFGSLSDAPHVVGVVTDLDDGLAARALTALRAEIARREHILAAAGASSYIAYRRNLTGPVGLARFFVIVDEFRVLAEELPDFVTGLVRLAAVGRSLGMHLVLATQRPGGAVTADMRANLDVRVALRVRERSDSIDVIDTPHAARISRTTPGRGYLAASGESPIEFQTAFSAGHRVAPIDDPVHVHPLRPSPSGWIEETAECDGCRAPISSELTDRDLFRDEARRLAAEWPAPHRPLLPPLPHRLEPPETVDGPLATATHRVTAQALLDLSPPTTLLHRTTKVSGDGGPHDDDTPMRAFAVVDLPAQQAQPLVVMVPGCHVGIGGAPRSGRSTAARTIADSLGRHAHVRDRRSGPTLWWASPGGVGAPSGTTCAQVFDTGDPDEVVRLLTALGDADSQAEDGPSCVVVDGWEELHATLLRINHGLAVDDMLRHVAEGHRHQRTFVVTGARTVLASKLSALLELKLILRQNDTSEYSLAGLRPAQVPAAMPPGRALTLPHGHALQFCDRTAEKAP